MPEVVVDVLLASGLFCGLSIKFVEVGRGVGLLVVVANVAGAFVVSFRGLCVVKTVEDSGSGQHTPGTNRLLKHSDSLKLLRLSNNAGQELKSSQRPGLPLGVLQRFSTSLAVDSSDAKVI